jgi:CHAT domain-containing protein
VTEQSPGPARPAGCPDPAWIAAHADGRLSGEEAARMDEHIAGCADCYEIFSETVQCGLSQDAAAVRRAGAGPSPAFARRRVFRVVALAAAASIVLAVGALLYRARAPRGAAPRVAELAQAMGTRRFVEPRLTGGFRHGPLVVLRSGEQAAGLDAQAPGVLAAVARIRERAESDTSPEALGALAVTYLVSGDAGAAVKALQSATAQKPHDPRLLSDLAAAYLVRAARADETADLPQALEAAERAIARPDPPVEAYFNRALALERLHLVSDARQAWQDYLERDSSSEWAVEARQRLAGLPKEPRSRLEEDRVGARAAVAEGRAAVDRLAGESPAVLREYWANELLYAWAEARRIGRDAAADRERLELVAAAISRATGDALPADTVRAISDPEATATAADPVGAQAAGFAALREAERLFDRQEPPCHAYRRALRELRAGGSPYTAWVGQQLVNACLLRPDPARAVAELDRLLPAAVTRRHTDVRCRVHWRRGLLHGFRGELTDALRDYDQARDCFQELGDLENVAFMLMLRTESLQLMGEVRGAWRDRARALGLLAWARNPRRRHAMLGEAALACRDVGLPRSALHFADALVAAARAWSRPTAISDATVIRAGIYHALDDDDRAAADLDESRQAIARIAEPAAAAEQEAETSAASGLILAGRDPEQAARALQDALQHFRATAPFRVPALHHLRARALLARGAAEEAEAELGAGIAALERGRIQLRDAALQASFFDQALPLFDDMVRLQVASGRDPQRALAFVERARARQLSDSLAGAAVAPLDPAALRRELPPHVALVYYLSLEDRLFAWALSREGARFIERPLTADELSGLVTAYRTAVERRAPVDALRRAASRLHAELVRPFMPFIASQRALVFIPDGVLQSLPFAGLWNAETGRYLVEDYVLGLAPSGTVFVRASAAAGRARGPAQRALTVGNPRIDQRLWRGLPDLPGAEAEAAEVASLYPQAEVLRGAEATKAVFLERLRRSEVVHYAGHAASSEESPSTTRLLLAPDAARGDSGALYIHEIGSAALPRTRLVVLAACRTGAGAVSRVEGALGLGRPFLAAAVPDVVASLWDIDDSLSREFFVGLHRALQAEPDPAVALRNTQLAQLRRDDAALAHPASWAAFVCMGGLDPRSLSKGDAS